ncbi:hypothetical protein LUZ60_003238 [Juncus effusus]|nr:hypothetical protein LUZ60_003238 [Juncus effusus]
MEVFYSEWIVQKQQLLNDLLSVPQDRADLQNLLISRALSHYSEYCQRMSELAERDVFQVLAPHWLTSIEISFLWNGGVKPCVLFRLIPKDLTVDKRRQVHQLRQETIEVESALESKMRILEDAVIMLMALSTVHGPHKNGEARADITHRVAELMRRVYIEADGLRRMIITRILEILSIAQTVQYFAEASRLLLRLRQSGLRQMA